MQIIKKFSELPGGNYHGYIRDIQISKRKNDRGKYLEYMYCIIIEDGDEAILITPKVFRSNSSTCSHETLINNLKPYFHEQPIDIEDHIGLEVFINFGVRYSNDREYLVINYYFPWSEYENSEGTEEDDNLDLD